MPGGLHYWVGELKMRFLSIVMPFRRLPGCVSSGGELTVPTFVSQGWWYYLAGLKLEAGILG